MGIKLSDAPHLRRQFLAIWRISFRRFFESEITAQADDFRLAFFALISLLAMPGVIVPILLASANGPDPASWGWIALVRHAGTDALRFASLPDKTLYLGFAMVVSGALTLFSWRSLLPERDDGTADGAMPVHAVTVTSARLVALLSYIGLIAAAIHVLPSLAFGTLLASGNSFEFAARGVLAHFVASVGACFFAALAIVSLQGVLMVPRWKGLTIVASCLHWVAPGLVAIALLYLPTVAGEAVRTARAGADFNSWILAVPPIWFLGIYETIIGTASPTLHQANAYGWLALLSVTVITMLVYGTDHPVSAAISPQPGAPGDGRIGPLGRWLVTALSRAGCRERGARAIFRFYLLILSRGPRQRAVLATALGAMIAWSLPGLSTTLRQWGDAPRPELLAWPFIILVLGLIGLRAAAALPVDQRSDWFFDFLAPSTGDIRHALSRSASVLVVFPVSAGGALLYWRLWGPIAALSHLAISLSYGGLLVAVLLWRKPKVPGYGSLQLNVAHLRLWWPVYLIAFSAATAGIGSVEYLAIDSPVIATLLTLYFWAISSLIRRHARTIDVPATLRLDAQIPQEPWYSGLTFRLSELVRETRLAIRRLARSPVYTVTSVITLAIGIGITVVAWTVLTSTPSPTGIATAGRVFVLEPRPLRAISWLDFVDLRNAQRSYLSLEAWSDFPAAVSGHSSAFLTEGTLITGGYFGSLGIKPLAGRLIQPQDDREDAPRVVVLSEALWRREFNSKPEVLNVSVRIGEELYEIVGIAPISFRGLSGRVPGVYVPITHPPLTDGDLTVARDVNRRSSAWLHAFGRLNANVTERQAQAEISVLGRALDESGKPSSSQKRSWSITPVERSGGSGDNSRTGWLLFLVPMAVLLVACTNLANLVLSRGAVRQNEFSVRRALGASRSSLLQSHLAEVAWLTVAGTTFGWVLASAALAGLNNFVLSTFGYSPQWQSPASLGWPAVPALLVIVSACFIVTGFLPAVQLTRRPLLPNAVGSQLAPPSRGRAHLVSAQVALSMMLLLIASLATRTLYSDAGALQTGIRLEQLAVVNVPFGLLHRNEAVVSQMAEEAAAGVKALPMVESSTVISTLPGVGGCCVELTATIDNGTQRATSSIVAGGPEMFATLGITASQGRLFGHDDKAGNPPVVVVSESLFRMLFGASGELGQQIAVRRLIARVSRPRTFATVVGVVQDVRSPRTGAVEHVAYVPLAQDLESNVSFVARVRPGADAGSVAHMMEDVIRKQDSRTATSFTGRGDVLAGGAALTLRLIASVASALSLIALALSMTGLYGVLAHLVASRRTELGVRLALGAAPSNLLRLVFADGFRAIGVGILAGIGIAGLARLSAQPLLVRFASSIDWLSIVIAVASLVSTGALACVLPARRASRTDPLSVIRNV